MQNHQGDRDPLGDPKDGHILTRAIIDTIREPLIVLDGDLRIIVASRSFYKKFGVDHKTTHEKLFYDLGNGEWNIPALRVLLENVISEHTAVEDYEVVHDFISLGKRTMLVNAREIRYENGRKKMLLSIFDITDQRAIEYKLEKLAEQKNILLAEMSHRIANSLQLISSILLLKAASVDSGEARKHLEDAHENILSLASVQRHLDSKSGDGKVQIAAYLTILCASLAKSMIGGRKPITLNVRAGPGTVTSEEAVSFGLLTTELVINALKYAFPSGEGDIVVSYELKDSSWKLVISDNGIGYEKDNEANQRGLGTSIVGSLAQQLSAELVRESSSAGTSVSLFYPNAAFFAESLPSGT